MSTNPRPSADPTSHPAPDPARLAERLVSRVREHLELARTLDRLSQAQNLAVRGGDTATTLDLLAQREPVVARTLQLNEEVAPLVTGLGAPSGPSAAGAAGTATGLTPAARQDLLADLREIDRLMSAVAQRDREDEAVLAAQRTTVAQQLSGVITGGDAIAAYAHLAKPAGGQPHFQDRQG